MFIIFSSKSHYLKWKKTQASVCWWFALQILSVVASLALPDAAHREREGARDSR